MADETMLTFIKEMLGYSDAQWETWKSNPRNLKMAGNLMDVLKYKVVAKVTFSSGCGAGHKVGDRIVFGGDGTLLCRESPDRVCVGLLSPVNPIIGGVLDKICNGEDPTQMAFNKVHCIDVGVDHGGWGEVVVEVKVEKAQE
jgi:uncharacterized repeat protein (TIGR04076 family)